MSIFVSKISKMDRFLQKVCQAIPDTILLVNKNLSIERVIANNEVIGSTSEITDQKMDGLPGYSYPGKIRESFKKEVATCIKEMSTREMKFPLMYENGSYLYLKVRLVPVDDEHVILYLRDDTKWVERENESEICEQNKMMEMAMKKSNVTAFSFNFKRFNTCDRVNCNRCFQFYGSNNELLSRNRHICRALPVLSHPEDRHDFFFLFNNLRDQKIDEASVSFRLKDNKNEYRHYKVYGRVKEYDSEGKANLIVGSVTDNQVNVEYERLLKENTKKDRV